MFVFLCVFLCDVVRFFERVQIPQIIHVDCDVYHNWVQFYTHVVMRSCGKHLKGVD